MAFGAHGNSGSQLALRPHYWSSLGEGRALPDCISSELSPLNLCVFGTAVEQTGDRILKYESLLASTPYSCLGAIETRSVRAASLHHVWHVIRIEGDRPVPETTGLRPGQRLSLGLSVHSQVMFRGMLRQCTWLLPHARTTRTALFSQPHLRCLEAVLISINTVFVDRRMIRTVKVMSGLVRTLKATGSHSSRFLSLSLYA
jgi:hypothetical protein